MRSQINPDTILRTPAIQIATLQTGKAHQGLQGGYLRCSEPKDSIRVDLKPKIKKIDLDGALLWVGFGRGVRVVGGGNFARFVVFLAL